MFSCQQLIIKHEKEQETMAHTWEIKQLIGTVLEEAHPLDLLNKDFKLAIINIFKELKKSCLKNKSMRIMAHQIENFNKEIQMVKTVSKFKFWSWRKQLKQRISRGTEQHFELTEEKEISDLEDKSIKMIKFWSRKKKEWQKMNCA